MKQGNIWRICTENKKYIKRKYLAENINTGRIIGGDSKYFLKARRNTYEEL